MTTDTPRLMLAAPESRLFAASLAGKGSNTGLWFMRSVYSTESIRDGVLQECLVSCMNSARGLCTPLLSKRDPSRYDMTC